MSRFEDRLFEAVVDCLARIDERVRATVFVVGLFVTREGDDRRKPTMKVFYNTEVRATDEDRFLGTDEERRWFVPGMCEGGDLLNASEAGTTLLAERNTWVVERGHWFGDGDLERLSAEELGWDRERQRWRVYLELYDIVTRVARRIHESGKVLHLFGRTVPVVIDCIDEEGGVLAGLTQAANPPGVADEYCRFIAPGTGCPQGTGCHPPC